MPMNDLLFVYGSLLSANNYFADYLSKNAQFINRGTFYGILYDVGEYPGALLIEQDSFPISGSIYRLNHPAKALEILDDYEGFGPTQELPNLFIRELLTVDTSNGTIDCWIYLYNRSTQGLAVIKSGNYQQYLKTKA